MSSNESLNVDGCAPEIIYLKEETNPNLLPDISRKKYNRTYETFIQWKSEKKENSINENVLLAYFKELSDKYKSSSLSATYSILKTTLNFYNNIKIENYLALRAFLKQIESAHTPYQGKTLSLEEINKFIAEAHDYRHLAIKVALIMALMGACHISELHNIEMKDIQDFGNSLLVTIPKSRNKPTRKFKVSGQFYDICKKYIVLRPKSQLTSFFLNYQYGKVVKQKIGINKLGSMPKYVATFLKLPEPEKYTGHCFKRSSASLSINANGNIDSLDCHGEWKSTVTEGYTDESIKIKEETSEILNSVDPTSSKTMEINPASISFASPEAATYTNTCNNKDIHVNLNDGKNVLVFNISNSSNINIFINKP